MSMLKCLLIPLSLFVCSCAREESTTLNPKRLTSEQLSELLEDVAIQPIDSDNFHVFYNEHLNDSTWVLHILQNETLGSEELGICEVLDFKGRHVFVYDSCRIKLSEDIKSKDGWPFQNDGVAFHLLVENRRGLLGYFTLEKRIKFDTEPLDSLEIVPFKLYE